jgi:hypothetical protein
MRGRDIWTEDLQAAWAAARGVKGFAIRIMALSMFGIAGLALTVSILAVIWLIAYAAANP